MPKKSKNLTIKKAPKRPPVSSEILGMVEALDIMDSLLEGGFGAIASKRWTNREVEVLNRLHSNPEFAQALGGMVQGLMQSHSFEIEQVFRTAVRRLRSIIEHGEDAAALAAIKIFTENIYKMQQTYLPQNSNSIDSSTSEFMMMFRQQSESRLKQRVESKILGKKE